MAPEAYWSLPHSPDRLDMNGKVQCTYDKNIAILPHGGCTAIVILTHSSPIHSGHTNVKVTALNGVSHVGCSNHYTVLHS